MRIENKRFITLVRFNEAEIRKKFVDDQNNRKEHHRIKIT